MTTSSYLAETLRIEGPDAIAFAQAQFSGDLRHLLVGQWQFNAWLDPRGRVRALFHLARLAEDRLLLLLRGGEAASLSAALLPYLLRSKARIEPQVPRTLGTSGARPMYLVDTSAATLRLGCGTHCLVLGAHPDNDWRVPQLEAGWPWLPSEALGTHLASSLSLHHLKAVALDKGCYPGQEIVARLHYRGGNKNRLFRVKLSHRVPPGQKLSVPGQVLGQLLEVAETAAGVIALAILNTPSILEETIVLTSPEASLHMHLEEAFPP